MTNETTASERETLRDELVAAYMQACKGRDADHNEVGYPYFLAGWSARAALAAPADQPRSQKMRDAGFTPRPTWKSLPKDDDDEGSPMTTSQEALAAPQQGASSPDPQLLKFYAVSDYQSLVAAMLHHIEKLQAKLPKDDQPLLTMVRA